MSLAVFSRLIGLLAGLLPACRTKNKLLCLVPGWSVHPTARVAPVVLYNIKALQISEFASVGFGSFIRNVSDVRLDFRAHIGKGNSMNSGNDLTRFAEAPKSYLHLGREAIVTWRHYVDCSGGFSLGAFSMLAGRQSVVLTHGVDIRDSVNRIAPVTIGEYCFVGTNVRIVSGVSIADKIVVGAGSVVSRDLLTSESLYAGAPAVRRKSLEGAAYFDRTLGHVFPAGHPSNVG